MRIYSKQDVFEAALDRMRFIFDEFPHVVPTMSGGKDSTVVTNLALIVAEERGRLPLPVLFIDQEAEWIPVINYVRRLFQDSRIQPVWLQVPIRYTSGTSGLEDRLFYSWDPQREGQWMRDKEPNSVHENTFGTDRFKKMFRAWLRTTYPQEKACTLGGVRTEESPARYLGLTVKPKYKWVTWGSHNDGPGSTRYPHYTFYPIYDWATPDVWKAIHDNKWPYCELYDRMYQQGTPVPRMRVSSINHEIGQMSLFTMHEMDAETWELATQRLVGANTLGKMGRSEYFAFKLPGAFRDWREYRDYLTENLIPEEVLRVRYRARWAADDQAFLNDKFTCSYEYLLFSHVNTLTMNDTEFAGHNVFCSAHRKFSSPRTDVKYVTDADGDGEDDPTSI